jgi:hypothetical protein
MARKFFYVCAGIFLLALSYHIGAERATAQASYSVFGAIDDANVTFISGGMLHATHVSHDTGFDGQPVAVALPHAGTIVAAVSAVGGNPTSIRDFFVVYEDGLVWQYTPDGGWRTIGSMTGEMPTAVTPSTWGQLKDHYRK